MRFTPTVVLSVNGELPTVNAYKKILMSKENGTQRYSYVSVISIYQFVLLKTNKDYLAKKIEI